MRSRAILAVALVFGVAAPAFVGSARAQAPNPPVTVTGIHINSLTPVGNQLIADATVTLNVVGRQVRQTVFFPIGLDATPNADPAGCPILNLSVGPIDLNLLGLIVTLDNCAGGPVTVDVTAIPGGGLLGDLLCGLANLLNGGLGLGDILGGLTGAQTTQILGGLTDLLNQLLGQVLTGGTPAVGGPEEDGLCPILSLDIPSGLHLNLLGLAVDTSGICLDVSAQPGPGNLLGNLLCSLEDLLNNNGNNGHAELVLVRNILRILNGLGL